MELRGCAGVFNVDHNLESIKSLSLRSEQVTPMLPAIVDGGAPAETQLMGWSLHHFFVLSTSFDALVCLKEEAKTKPELKLDR